MSAIKEVMAALELKFTSGNDHPVTVARITREEYEAIKAELEVKSVFPLKAGTVIAYMGFTATVTEDAHSPEGIPVQTEEGYAEVWDWECEGKTCRIFAYGETHAPL